MGTPARPYRLADPDKLPAVHLPATAGEGPKLGVAAGAPRPPREPRMESKLPPANVTGRAG